MRILQVVQKPQRRGAEVFAFQLSRELRRQGHEVCILYLYPFSGEGSLPIEPGDRVLDGWEGHPLEKTLGFHPGLLLRVGRLITEFDPEIVQVNGGRAVKYGALCRSLRRDGSWVLIYRNIGQPARWVQGWPRHVFYRKLVMPRVDGVVGVSESTLAQVVDFYGLGVPSTCIPNAIDPGALIAARSREAVRSGAGVPIEGRVLLFVGSLTEEKRVDRLLRLMRRVCEAVPDAHLWLVGDGPLRGELERHAEELSVTPCVHFLGTQANVATFMKAADLFLLTSDSEGMPAVILEAGLLGLPVVATRVGGLPESVLDGKTGVLVDPQDEEGLFCAVLRLLQNLQDATALGSSATAWVRANFTMDVIAQRYVTFYNTVLGHS